MLLIINNLHRPEIGQSRIVEQVVKCLEEVNAPAVVLRASSASVLAQLALIFRIWCRCLSGDIRSVYYTPSRARLSIFRDLGIYLACGLHRRKLIVHWHGRDIDIYRHPAHWHIRLSKRFLNSAVHVCIAEQQAAAIRDIWPGAKTNVIPNVVDPKFLADVERLQDGIRETRSDRKQVVMIGNLMMSKGVGLFCEIAKEMAAEPVDFHLFGPFGNDNEADAETVACLVDSSAPYLHYHGPAYGEEKVVALTKADIFLFPSYYRSEAMPLVVLEALAAGCWVIASDIGYLRELDSPQLQLIECNKASEAQAVFVRAICQAPRREPVGVSLEKKASQEIFKARLMLVLFQID